VIELERAARKCGALNDFEVVIMQALIVIGKTPITEQSGRSSRRRWKGRLQLSAPTYASLSILMTGPSALIRRREGGRI
jgi:hypothetical protein